MTLRPTIFAFLGALLVTVGCSGDEFAASGDGGGGSSSSGTGGSTSSGTGGSTSSGTGGSSSSGTGGSSSSGTGGSSSSGSGGNGGGGGNPVVDCLGVDCGPTEICCVESNSATCVPDGTCGGVPIGCDDTDDCGDSGVCCHENGGFSCEPICNGMLICDTGQDCPQGEPNCCLVMQGIVSVCLDACP